MLTWDDYNQEESASVATAAPEPAVVAAAAAAQRVVETPEPPAMDPAPAEPSPEAMQAAEAVIANRISGRSRSNGFTPEKFYVLERFATAKYRCRIPA